MQDTTQISAFISMTTKERLERYADAHGMKKASIIEAALLHHLQALDELPVDILVPARIVLTPDSFAQVVDRLENPRAPTEAMNALMSGQPVEGLDD